VEEKKAVLEGDAAADAVEEEKEEAAVATEEAGTPGGVKKKKEPPVECIHEHADLVLRREFPEICDALAEEAKKGNIPALKLLLEIAKSGGAKAEQQGGKSLSELLMDELKRRQDEREAAADAAKAKEQIAKDAGNGDAGNGDAGNGGAKSGGEAEHA
jgi:hypothetical protein